MELENLSKEEKEQTVSDFLSLIDTIPAYNISLIDNDNLGGRSVLDDMRAVMENSMLQIREASNKYLIHAISIEEFKNVLIKVVNRETDSLVIGNIDDNGNTEVLSSDYFREINNLVINQFDELSTLKFAKYLYNEVFSPVRTEVIKKYTGGPFLVLKKGMQPQKLKVLDEIIEKLGSEQNSQIKNKKPLKKQ